MIPILVLLRLCLETIARVFLHLRFGEALAFRPLDPARAQIGVWPPNQQTSLSSFLAFWELRERQAFQVFSFHEISSDLGAAKFASCRTSGESFHPKPNDAWRDRRLGRRQVSPINHERRLATHDVQQHANTPLAVEALQHAKAAHKRTCNDPHGLPNA